MHAGRSSGPAPLITRQQRRAEPGEQLPAGRSLTLVAARRPTWRSAPRRRPGRRTAPGSCSANAMIVMPPIEWPTSTTRPVGRGRVDAPRAGRRRARSMVVLAVLAAGPTGRGRAGRRRPSGRSARRRALAAGSGRCPCPGRSRARSTTVRLGAGRRRRLDDLDVQVDAVGGGDGQRTRRTAAAPNGSSRTGRSAPALDRRTSSALGRDAGGHPGGGHADAARRSRRPAPRPTGAVPRPASGVSRLVGQPALAT